MWPGAQQAPKVKKAPRRLTHALEKKKKRVAISCSLVSSNHRSWHRWRLREQARNFVLGDRATEGFAVSVHVDDIIISADRRIVEDMARRNRCCGEEGGFTWSAVKQDGPASIITAFNIKLQNTGIQLQQDRLEAFRLAFQVSTSDHQKNGIFGYVRSIDAAACR